MAQPQTIAIDGPAGSGKSTICEHIAQRYGYTFVDTGAFYRAVTYALMTAEVPLSDEAAVKSHIENLSLRFVPNAEQGYRVLVDDEDITNQLRSKAVEAQVPQVAQMAVVRTGLLPLQREVATQGKIILAGRDIGTVVLPDADLKIYLDASLEERARRRYEQLQQSGRQGTLQEVQQDLAARDKVDSERSLAPLKQAEDAVYILTDGLGIEAVIEAVGQHLAE